MLYVLFQRLSIVQDHPVVGLVSKNLLGQSHGFLHLVLSYQQKKLKHNEKVTVVLLQVLITIITAKRKNACQLYIVAANENIRTITSDINWIGAVPLGSSAAILSLLFDITVAITVRVTVIVTLTVTV